jgi:hypothetical protein
MHTVSLYRLVGISFFVIVLCISFVCPTHGETLIPLFIKKGTNLIHIAQEYCNNSNDWHEIARINKLKSPYIIKEKSTLKIPLSLLKVNNLSAKVAMTKDEVSLLQDEKKIGTVHNNDLLHPGQTLETDEKGYAYLVFPDNKFTRVAPSSKITLNYLLRLADGDLKTELLLTKGRIRHLIKQKLRRNETFRTRTPVAVTGVRGTDFRIKIDENGSNTVETLGGTVQLSAGGQAVALRRGEGSRVVEGKAPETPRRLPQTPAPVSLQDVYKALPGSLSLPEQKNVSSFRIRVTQDEAGNDPVVERIVPSGKKVQLETLTDGLYYFSVTAIDNDNYESLPAGPYPLALRTVPTAPYFSSPKDNSISWEDNMTISWLESEGALKYQVDLADDKDFTHVLASEAISEAHYTTPSLPPGTYYFRVRAVASDGFTSLYSQPLSWKIMKQAPVVLGAPSEDGSLTIQWAPSGDSARYDLQVAVDDTFQDIIIDRQGLPAPSCTINEYIDPGSYALRIRFTLEDGQFSPWMPTQKMTIEAGSVGMEHILLVASFFLLILL